MKFSRQRWPSEWQGEWQRLRALDWQALDLRDAGTWPWLVKVLCGVLVLVAALAVSSVWWVSDYRSALISAQRQEVRLLNNYRSSVHAAGLLNNVRSQLTDLAAQMVSIHGMWTTRAEIPSLLDSISSAAEQNQLTIEAIHLRPTVIHHFYSEHPLDIRVLGSYHQLAQFINDISSLPRLVTQHTITLAPAEGPSDGLTLSLVAKAYSSAASEDSRQEELNSGVTAP
ncbi:MAG: type 4a pilus biogenesis protein PilO [Halomonadaceae bacterium]|uniref:Type 4a pilus biogenesis protein PilO n=1 Tax=Halomonas colorata TaxID=2742615 RepID=A0ABR9FW08_9GAMM|nr:type 4a pilus biogenesis protein PilO [Halomonas colorata]MBE0462831.1 type 4a pilus biogenesis protein PilO [Halomonas colorata]